MKKCFDNIDTRILKALQRNGRLQNNELAKRLVYPIQHVYGE